MPHSQTNETQNEIEKPPIYHSELIRWIEFILCTACLVLGIYLAGELTWIAVLLLLPVASVYVGITAIDAVFGHVMRPIPLKTWVVMSVSAFVLFVGCFAGCIIALLSISNTIFVIMAIALNLVTACAFLLDFVYALLIRIKTDEYLEVEQACEQADAACGVNMPPTTQQKQYVRVPPPQRHPMSAPACHRPRSRSNKIGPTKEIPITHGGTFPVCKDLTPIVPECKTSKPTWSDGTSNISAEGCSRFEQRRTSHLSLGSQAQTSRSPPVRYAVKIGPLKVQHQKPLGSLASSPRSCRSTEDENYSCCKCLPIEETEEASIAARNSDDSLTPSVTKFSEAATPRRKDFNGIRYAKEESSYI